MNDREAHQWTQIRQRGRGRFLLVDSLLRRGVVFASAMTLFQGLRYGWERPRILLGIWIFETLLFGLGSGWLHWSLWEKAYRQYQGEHAR